MTDENTVSPSQEDRRALLAVYSANVLQYPGIAVAGGAALLAELVVFFDKNFSDVLPHGVFFALLVPTLLFIGLLVDAYFLERGAIQMVLRRPMPTYEVIREELKDSVDFDPTAIDQKDGLRALDEYYTILVNRHPNPITSLILKGPRAMLGSLVVGRLGDFDTD